MTRSELDPVPYFDRYINLCEDETPADALQRSLREIRETDNARWTLSGDYAYAPGKWTLKELIQHMIDTERIFNYRALCFARGEQQQLPGFDEDGYAAASEANRREITSLMEEWDGLRQSTIRMFESFTKEMLNLKGRGATADYSPAQIAFMIAGHQRWHMRVINEKYFGSIGGEK